MADPNDKSQVSFIVPPPFKPETTLVKGNAVVDIVPPVFGPGATADAVTLPPRPKSPHRPSGRRLRWPSATSFLLFSALAPGPTQSLLMPPLKSPRRPSRLP